MVRPLVLLPAVDVVDGVVVQHARGQAAGAVPADPVAAARHWQSAGAPWLHLVDLDQAHGRGANASTIAAVVDGPSIPIELSGGIADDATLAVALAGGAARIVLATSALADLDWCAAVVARHGPRIAVGLDVRGDRLHARGGGAVATPVAEAIGRLDAAGAARYVVTDTDRDGSLDGPNLELLHSIAALTSRPLVASGGVAGLDDLVALRERAPASVDAVIVGSALYAERFTLGEAIAVASGP